MKKKILKCAILDNQERNFVSDDKKDKINSEKD